MNRRRIVAISFGLPALVIAGTIIGIRHHRAATFVPLPAASEIAEMRVDVGALRRMAEDDTSGEGEEDHFKFTVPKEHWQPILDSFAPHERTLLGATKLGVKIGGFNFRMTDGREVSFTVLVFFHENKMIFSLGPNRYEHIGGDKLALYQALKTAHAAALQK